MEMWAQLMFAMLVESYISLMRAKRCLSNCFYWQSMTNQIFQPVRVDFAKNKTFLVINTGVLNGKLVNIETNAKQSSKETLNSWHLRHSRLNRPLHFLRPVLCYVPQNCLKCDPLVVTLNWCVPIV